jgi:hypothetical protein
MRKGGAEEMITAMHVKLEEQRKVRCCTMCV